MALGRIREDSISQPNIRPTITNLQLEKLRISEFRADDVGTRSTIQHLLLQQLLLREGFPFLYITSRFPSPPTRMRELFTALLKFYFFQVTWADISRSKDFSFFFLLPSSAFSVSHVTLLLSHTLFEVR